MLTNNIIVVLNYGVPLNGVIHFINVGDHMLQVQLYPFIKDTYDHLLPKCHTAFVHVNINLHMQMLGILLYVTYTLKKLAKQNS